MYAVPKHLEKFKYKIKGTKSHNLVSRVTFSQPHTAVALGIIQLHTDRSLSIHLEILNSFQRKHNASAEVHRLRNGHPKEGFNQLEQLLIRNVAKLLFSSVCFFLIVKISKYIVYFCSDIMLKYFLNCAIQNMPDLEVRRDKTASGCVCVCICVKN